MGERGLPPTPTRTLKMRGSWRAKTRKDEPPTVPGRPVPPEKFSKACREIWELLVVQLEAMQLLSPTDGWQLERYCRLYVRWRRCENHLDICGLANSKLEAKESYRLDAALKQIERNFGLTPADRARMTQTQANATNVPITLGKERFFA